MVITQCMCKAWCMIIRQNGGAALAMPKFVHREDIGSVALQYFIALPSTLETCTCVSIAFTMDTSSSSVLFSDTCVAN